MRIHKQRIDTLDVARELGARLVRAIFATIRFALFAVLSLLQPLIVSLLALASGAFALAALMYSATTIPGVPIGTLLAVSLACAMAIPLYTLAVSWLAPR